MDTNKPADDLKQDKKGKAQNKAAAEDTEGPAATQKKARKKGMSL